MEYRQLGRTGLKVSPFGLGTMLFGGKTNEHEAQGLVERAVDAGVNLIDTANVYGRGRSEETLGAIFQKTGYRSKVVLSTKVNVRMDDTDPNAAGNHRRHIREQCEASLHRLGTDWIDLYFIHRPAQNIPIDETLRALDDLVRAGKVNHIGCSTFAAWSVVESLWVSKEYGLNRFVCEQPPYHLLDRAIEAELIPMALSYGLGLLAWSPLAGGLLSGKYAKTIPGDGRIQTGSVWGDRHFAPAVVRAVGELADLARSKGCTLTQLALAWCSTRPGISAALLGARTVEQWEEQIGALTVSLTGDDLSRIDAVCPPGKTLISYYHEDNYADFRPTEYRW